MSIIGDIRIYKSDVENIDGAPLPCDFNDIKTNIAIHRIVMKLRENSFSLGDFSHLYVNLTTFPVDGGIRLSKRSIDKYHLWYRYYDVSISNALFKKLGTLSTASEILSIVKNVLIDRFCVDFAQKQLVLDCFNAALSQGECMAVRFKERKTASRTALIYLRYWDDLLYHPVLKVFDVNNTLLFEADLPSTPDLSNIGLIQLSNKKVTIKPRTALYNQSMQPITFTY